jgi:DnaK suppressor protein
MAIDADRRREAELGQIDAALKRIENGSYGYCVTCEEPIAPKRLEHDPAVPQCINCARRGSAA